VTCCGSHRTVTLLGQGEEILNWAVEAVLDLLGDIETTFEEPPVR
jgi:hypothetical protein